MVQCSTTQNPSEYGPCRGVVFESAISTCWWKNGNATFESLTSGATKDTAIAHADQFANLDTACPFEDGSSHTTANGLGYKIYCGLDFAGSDIDLGIYDLYSPWHADSLEECMELCSTGRPLCRGVSFNPDLYRGYRNCYPKISSNSSAMSPRGYATHSAIAQFAINTTCVNENYTTPNGQIFQNLCSIDLNGPAPGPAYRTESLELCIDSCSRNESCKAISYNPDATNGFENCYPKSAPGDRYSHDNTNSAVFVAMGPIPDSGNATQTNTTSSPTSSSTSAASSEPTSESSSSGGGSKAWIAGAVVGPLAGIALLAGLAVWWRRRKRGTHAGNTVAEKPERPKELDANEQQKHELGDQQKYEIGHGDHRHELPS